MSPDIIIIDEIGADDAEGISAVARCGIPIVATAHAGSYEELLSRSALYPLIGSGVFSVFVGIFKAAGEYSLTVDRR
jgi:stage III sporulation protein AA